MIDHSGARPGKSFKLSSSETSVIKTAEFVTKYAYYISDIFFVYVGLNIMIDQESKGKPDIAEYRQRNPKIA